MGGRGHHHHLLFAPGNRRDLPVRFGVAHQAQVGLVRHHRVVHLLGPQILHQQLRFRHPAGQFALQTRHIRDADGVDCGHPDRALHPAFELVHRLLEFFLAAQHVAAEFEVHAPGFGQLEGPRAAVQQLTPSSRSVSCRYWLAADWLTPQTSAPRLMFRARAMSRKSLKCSRVIPQVHYKPRLYF